jgi:peptide/nickel transport system permease protein
LLLQESFPRLIEKAPKVGGWEHFTQTIFFQKNVRLLWFDFGRSDTKDVDIADEIKRRMGPSLCLTLPNALLGVFTYLVLSMLVAYARGTYFDRLALFLCVIGMSISTLFYIVAGQTIFGVQLKLAPISGFSYDLSVGWKFLMLPIIVAVIGGIGGSTRFYRTVFLEELGRDYIRTARSKGAGEGRVLFVHALRNSMIPIITNVVVGIPMLFFGSLLLESFFAIPGLGGFTVEAIGDSDFSVIRAMVYLGSVLYIAGLILTDICYAWADPRVRLQ